MLKKAVVVAMMLMTMKMKMMMKMKMRMKMKMKMRRAAILKCDSGSMLLVIPWPLKSAIPGRMCSTIALLLAYAPSSQMSLLDAI